MGIPVRVAPEVGGQTEVAVGLADSATAQLDRSRE